MKLIYVSHTMTLRRGMSGPHHVMRATSPVFELMAVDRTPEAAMTLCIAVVAHVCANARRAA